MQTRLKPVCNNEYNNKQNKMGTKKRGRKNMVRKNVGNRQGFLYGEVVRHFKDFVEMKPYMGTHLYASKASTERKLV